MQPGDCGHVDVENPSPELSPKFSKKSPKVGKELERKVVNERIFLDSGQVKCGFVNSAGKCLLNDRKVFAQSPKI